MMWSYALLDSVADRTAPDTADLHRFAMEGCESCGGDHQITVLASDASFLNIPCPCCLPNDALGG
jgi:hypothetical protein